MVQLMSGETLKQSDLEAKYHISRRTCQRDFSYVRSALSEYAAGDLVEHDGSYRLARQSEETDVEMVLTMSNILLGSRALDQDELTATLDYISSSLSPVMQAVVRQQLILSRGSYVPLSRAKRLLHRLREVAASIVRTEKLVFTYRSSSHNNSQLQVHHAQPVALFFETYYFYVAMLSEEHHGYWLYRLDRMGDILDTLPGDHLDYAERFSLQEHRNYTYLIDSGALTQIRFEYHNYLQTALDHFPGSRVVKQNADGSVVIEAFVKVDGALLWLMSQGAGLKVLSPVSLVDRIKSELHHTLNQYE